MCVWVGRWRGRHPVVMTHPVGCRTSVRVCQCVFVGEGEQTKCFHCGLQSFLAQLTMQDTGSRKQTTVCKVELGNTNMCVPATFIHQLGVINGRKFSKLTMKRLLFTEDLVNYGRTKGRNI